MQNRDLVSVIMGVHNTSKTKCCKAIHSIIEQTYSNWEFVICDDGSSDDTFNFLKKFSKIDTRIKVIRNRVNSGLAAALNKCIDNTKGNYIARMDDDDISLPSRLEKELNFLKENPEFCFVSSNFYINKRSPKNIKRMPEYPKKGDFLWTSPYLHPATMFKRSCLLKVNCYRVAKETRRAEDYDLFMRMKAMKLNGYNLQIPLYVYSIERKKTRYIDRIYEVKVRYINFGKLDFPLWRVAFYIIKPLIVGLLPSGLIYKFRTKRS